MTTAEIELLRDFVNTREPQLQREDLTSPAALQDWFSAHGLVAADSDAPVDIADLRLVCSLRETLRAILHGHAGHTGPDVDQNTVAMLNADLAKIPLHVWFDADGRPALVAQHRSSAHVVVAGLLSAVQEAIRAGTWERLKVCARDTCQWAFYDESRNRSGRWCSMAGCGNIVKMRRAHARRSDDASRGPATTRHP